jgi:hypothetical protein
MVDLIGYWQSNIKQNYKLISAFLTEIIITTILILAYGLRAGQSYIDILFMIWVSTNSAIFIIMRLIGKGEVAEIEAKYHDEIKKNESLSQQISYDQVIAGYAIQLAALKGQVPESIINNEKWIDANNILEKIGNE